MSFPVQRRAFLLLLVLVGGGMLLTVAPFLLPGATSGHGAALTGLPPALDALYNGNDLARAEAFSRPLVGAILASRLATLLGTLAILASGVAAWVDRRWGGTRRRWAAWALLFAGFYLWGRAIGLPFQFVKYQHFRAFGLSDMPVAEWLRLLAIGLPVALVTFALHYLFVICGLGIFRRWWPLPTAMIVLLCFSVIPEWFQNRPVHLEWELTPLPAGEHRAAMDETARAAGHAGMEFMVSDHSKRENTVNMYLAGHAAKKYVAVTDTFLRAFTPREAAVALAHEFGHHRDRVRFAVVHKTLEFAVMLVAFVLADRVARRRLAPGWERGAAAIPLVMLSLLVTGALFGPLVGAISRWEERRSDAYALSLTRDRDAFAGVLLKGARTNLERYDVPRWERWLLNGHPTLRERLHAAEAWACTTAAP
jgi:Zn-dependent protease with chaperone function